MSIPLLRDPDRLHDLIDDLQSHSWVMIYGALKRFLWDGRPDFLGIFDAQARDEEDRIVGGKDKYAAIRAGTLGSLQYKCPTLRLLIRMCSRPWYKYQLAIKGGPDRREYDPHDYDPEEMTMERLKPMLDLAPQPSYWIEKYVVALEEIKLCCGHSHSIIPRPYPALKTSANNLSHAWISIPEARLLMEELQVYAGRKHKPGNDEGGGAIDAEVTRENPLRRSKRIKQ